MSETAGVPEYKEVLINEGTGSHFSAECIDLSIDSCTIGTWSDHDFSFPISISVLAAQFIGGSVCGGDEIEFHIAPDTNLGAIAADVSVDDDIIDVGATAWSALKVGYFVNLTDGTNTDDLGRVLEKQADNKIKVQTAAVHAFTASTPTYIKMTVKMVPHGHLPSTSRLIVGESKIGGTLVVANTTFRVKYKNNDGEAKNFEFWLEYMY